MPTPSSLPGRPTADLGSEPGAPTSAAHPAWLAVRRDELALLAAGYRQALRAPRMWVVGAGGISTIVLLPVWAWLAERLGASEDDLWMVLAAAWAVMLVCLATLVVWTRQARAKYQFACPACASPLLDGSTERGQLSPLEIALASGHCPRCGAAVVGR